MQEANKSEHGMSKRSQIENNKPSEGPFAKFAGVLSLGGRELDVYVLSNEERVLSMRSMARTMAEVDHGRVGKIPGENVVLSLVF